jgi:hypothetical protein
MASQQEHGWTLLAGRFCPTALTTTAILERRSIGRRGAVDQILVHRLDRLSRSVRHYVTLLDEFRRLEVGLVIASTPELVAASLLTEGKLSRNSSRVSPASR